MNYGQIISEAFWISWRNRFLWVFGFFLGGGQIFNLLQNVNNLSQLRNVPFLGYDVPSAVFKAWGFVLDNLVLFLVLAVVLVLVGIFLSLTSQGALADSVAALHRGEERGLSSASRAGLSNFWRVLGFSVLFGLIGFFVGLVVVLPGVFILAFALSATGSSASGVAITVLVFLLFFGLILLFSIPLGIIFLLGLRALVVDGRGVGGSFGLGYDLFRRNLGRVLLVAVISFALSLGTSIALLLLALLTGLLLAVPALALFAAGLSTASVVAGVVAGVMLVILYVVAASAVATFNHAYWTIAYLRLNAPAGGDAFRTYPAPPAG